MRKWNAPTTHAPLLNGSHYVIKNQTTGQTKSFNSYKAMQEWYITLSLEESRQWSRWTFVF